MSSAVTPVPQDNIVSEKIAVLYGGDSAEREVSLMSGTAIAKGLTTAGFEVILIDTKGYCLSKLTELDIDRVFIALHGRGGEDGCIQGALEYMGIPYTGSGVLGSALSMDKNRSKQIMQALGLPTAPFIIVNKAGFESDNVEKMLKRLGGKVMVKPAHEGSSIGMSMAKSSDQLAKALTEAFVFDDEILVEAWITALNIPSVFLVMKHYPQFIWKHPMNFMIMRLSINLTLRNIIALVICLNMTNQCLNH